MDKRYIVVGDHIERPGAAPVYVEPLELCRLYGIDPKEAILVDRRHHTYRHIMRKYPHLPVLMPRADGYYDLKEKEGGG